MEKIKKSDNPIDIEEYSTKFGSLKGSILSNIVYWLIITSDIIMETRGM